MAEVSVNPELLEWALIRSGKAEEVKKKFPIDKWISQEKKPTFRQLENFSKMIHVPLGYLFLSKPPVEKLPVPHYRTLKDGLENSASTELIDTIQTMERRQAWMRDYLIRLGNPPLPYVATATVQDDPKTVAYNIREKLNLEEGWAGVWPNWEKALRELIRRVESIGILVTVNGVVGNNTHRKLNVNEFRGFVLVDEYAPLIFINGADGKAAQMFTLAHELAHVWLGEGAIFDLKEMQPADEKIELICNQIAAEFLVPEKVLRESWKIVYNQPARFQQLAREYKVSEIVIARRAQDLHLITKKEFFSFYNQRMQEINSEVKTVGGGDFYASQNLRIGNQFIKAVISETKSGHMLYQDAYRLTGLNGTTFDNYISKLSEGGYQ